MPTPDFPKLASAFGIESHIVTERENLELAVEDMLKSEGPYLLEVKIEKEANVFPMIYPGKSVDEIVLE
jgi:acetolactate synthase-1/2/3 large subunit